jgi:hypothetical protein
MLAAGETLAEDEDSEGFVSIKSSTRTATG